MGDEINVGQLIVWCITGALAGLPLAPLLVHPLDRLIGHLELRGEGSRVDHLA